MSYKRGKEHAFFFALEKVYYDFCGSICGFCGSSFDKFVFRKNRQRSAPRITGFHLQVLPLILLKTECYLRMGGNTVSNIGCCVGNGTNRNRRWIDRVRHRFGYLKLEKMNHQHPQSHKITISNNEDMKH